MKIKSTLWVILAMFLSLNISFGQGLADPYTNQPADYLYSTPVGSTQTVYIPAGNGGAAASPILANSVEWTFNFPDDILDVGTPVLPPGFYVYSSVTNGYDNAIKIRNSYDIPAPTPWIPQDFIFQFPVTGTFPNQQGMILANVRVLPGFNGTVGNLDALNDNGASPIIFTQNNPPVVPDTTVTTPEDTPVTICLPITDLDSADTHTATILCGPSNGTITSGPTVSGSSICVTYTPNANYNGRDSICVAVCDNNGACDTAKIIIFIDPVNDLPAANPDVVTTNEDTQTTIPVLINDTFGGDGPSTGTISITTQPTNGTATVNDGGTPNDPTDDQVVYTPNPDFNGTDTLIYQICDAPNVAARVAKGGEGVSSSDCDTAMVIITVNPVNDLPTANPDIATTVENVTIPVPVLNNDTFGGDGPSTGSITIADQPNHGTATVNDGGTPNNPADDQIIYTPDLNYNGRDTMIYQICDSNGDCDTALVIVSITSGGPLPVTLLSFNADMKGSSVGLTWNIEQEIGVKSYEILFSTDGNVFNKIGNITATNNVNYSFTHNSPVAGNNYYRIRIVDKDGKSVYSLIKMIKLDNKLMISVYPNPVQSLLNVLLPGTWINKAVKLTVSNQLGQTVLTKEIKTANQTEQLNMHGLPTGIYSLRIEQKDAKAMEVRKIEIKK